MEQFELNLHIHRMCAVEENVILCSRHGDVFVFSNVSMDCLYRFQLPHCRPALSDHSLSSVEVQCLEYVAHDNSLVFTLSVGLLLAYPASLHDLKASFKEASVEPRRVYLRSVFTSTVVDRSLAGVDDEVELWCGHTDGDISVLDSRSLEQLVLLHLPARRHQTSFTVMHLCAWSQPASGEQDASLCVWASTYPGTVVYCWDVVTRTCLFEVDCNQDVQGEQVCVCVCVCVCVFVQKQCLIIIYVVMES